MASRSMTYEASSLRLLYVCGQMTYLL